ncbi:hypothetical protein LXT21_43910 [Myxococcus sp. K38C18041901]|uniref:hypothetical protein n=1 Tax=Myxococcus guangdongensis TaxID=2906760 RepID=UPI0020A81DD4|nr:hypothetical protein [Myxococcus guangdongensis]MCP3065736.1 hypothetical protein [Myxococcus guangdongensis]
MGQSILPQPVGGRVYPQTREYFIMNRMNWLFAISFALAFTATPAQAQECVDANSAAGTAIQAAQRARIAAIDGNLYLSIFNNTPTNGALLDFSIKVSEEVLAYSEMTAAMVPTIGTSLGSKLVKIQGKFDDVIVSSSKIASGVVSPTGGGIIKYYQTYNNIMESTGAMMSLVSELPPFCN